MQTPPIGFISDRMHAVHIKKDHREERNETYVSYEEKMLKEEGDTARRGNGDEVPKLWKGECRGF